MLVDYERAWRDLREVLITKSGHGTFGPEGLLAIMARIEVECSVDEGPTERVLRLFGVQVSDDLIHFPNATTEEMPSGRDSSPGDRDFSRGDEHDPHRHRIPVHR